MVLWAIVYIPGLVTPPLLDDADSVHAEAAREMLVRHEWSTLYIDGIRYLEKAPLMYWAMAASFKVFWSEATGRRDLPVILGVLALLLATYSLGKRTLGERAGFWAAVVLTVSIGPYLFTRSSDSRHADRAVADVGLRLFPANPGRATALDCVVLGTGGDGGAQCAD